MCQAVEDFAMADRRVKVSTIAYEMCVSEGSVIIILYVKLGICPRHKNVQIKIKNVKKRLKNVTKI